MTLSKMDGGDIINIPQPDIVYVEFGKLRSDPVNTPTIIVPISCWSTCEPFKCI